MFEFDLTSDDAVEHRGEVDQYPIIVPVFEQNPEMRFVIGTHDGREGHNSVTGNYLDWDAVGKSHPRFRSP